MKEFRTTGACTPDKNYMVDIQDRIKQIKAMVDAGRYFTINRARQYGKTTTLMALAKYLKNDYIVLNIDFQGLDDGSFSNGNTFTQALAQLLIDECEFNGAAIPQTYIDSFELICQRDTQKVRMADLFRVFKRWCQNADKPILLFIDEVDSATNNQVFLDFLAQLRDGYISRDTKGTATFQSVILAGVTDVKNLKRKLRPEDAHKFNSPWNIAADFNIDMSLSVEGIAGMLDDYKNDHRIGMNTIQLAQEIHDYTEGYPFLVSRICQIIDTELIGENIYEPDVAWTSFGISEAVKRILLEKNTLFDSLMGKVYDNAPLREVLQRILFGGERISYNQYNIPAMDGEMYGFVRNDCGALAIANRIFEVLLYNYFLSLSEMKTNPISCAGSTDRDQLIEDGRLNLEKLLEHYVTLFDDIYEGKAETFSEEERRRRFLLYIRPIINGTSNYYIETETCNNDRMDIIVHYLG